MFKLSVNYKFGTIKVNIEKILAERGISKNKVCADLQIPRTNFNRYCRGEFQRLDETLICKLCYYLRCEVGDILMYDRPDDDDTNPFLKEMKEPEMKK